MSANVDERIVQMQFDNEQFERKAQNTITTLNSLNEALKLPTGNSGMEKLQATSRTIDFAKLNEAIELVNYRFSNLGIIATNVLNRIVDKAIEAGRKIAEALTIQPIKAGFSEYELQMDSVKRILNSAKDENGLPVTLDKVNEKLDELNRYADKTIYSFSDMTQNIGKFTNAGVDLDKSVAAIQGIANEAALSGANAQEASRAMYNFAQALSAGYVKLIDWKSIENANMATVSFKEELLKTALELGTVREEGDKYVTTTTDMNGKVSEAFDATSNFNEALSHQWLTSEVLTTTLAKYADETDELGQKAFQAATEVTTFSKLLETLKEAMGSGWTKTWQLIIGDYEEAKALWTGINNVLSGSINASADARNKLLSDWDVLGGRKAVLDGLKDAWGGLVNIANEVRWAFSLVLEEIDGFDLVNISLAIRNLGKSFRQFTGKHGADINGIAQGIASAFDLMSQTFSAIGRTISPLLSPLGELFGLILHNSGIAGRSFTDFVKSLRDNDSIYKGLQSVIAMMQKVYDVAGRAVSAVLKIFGIDTGFDSSINPLQAFVNALSNIGENKYVKGAADVFDRIREALTNLATSIKNSATLQNVTNVLSSVGNGLAAIGKVLGSGALFLLKSAGKLLGDLFGTLKNADPSNLINLFSAGSAATVIMGLKKMAGGLEAPAEGIKGFFDFIKNIGGLGEKIGKSLSDFANTITGPFKAMQESIKADILIKIAKAIAILAASIFVLSTIDPGRMGVALLGISALMGELTAVMTTMSKLMNDSDVSRFKSLGASMVAFGIAIGLLALAVKALASLDSDSLLNGVLAVGVLMTLATLMTKLGGNNFNAKGLISMSVAILILQISVKRLGELDPSKLTAGLIAVGVLMTLATLMSRLGSNNFSAKGLLTMSVSIFILQEVVKRLGELDVDALLNGLLAVGILMSLMTLMSKLGGKNLSGASVLMMAGAMLILQNVIENLGSMDTEVVGKGLLALALALGAIAIALNVMKGTLGGAVAITIVAAALNMLVPVIKALAAMPFETMLKSIAGLALALGVLIAAGYGAQAVVGPLLALAAAVALIGIGIAALGAGLIMAGAGLATFSASLVASAASIIATLGIIIQGVIGLIPLVASAVVKGIMEILRLIGDSAQTIVEVVVQIGVALIDGLRQLLVPLGTFIMDAVVFLLNLLASYAPAISMALVELVIQLIDGVSLAIYENTDRIIAAVRHLLGAIMDFILATLQEILSGIPGVGGKINDALQGVRDDLREGFGPEAGQKDGKAYTDGVASGILSSTGSLEDASSAAGEAGKNSMLDAFNSAAPDVSSIFGETLPEGILSSSGDLEDAAGILSEDTMAALGENFSGGSDTGLFLVQGVTDGITDNMGLATEASSSLGTGITDALNAATGVHSPSTLTWETGLHMDEGLANGLLDNQGIIDTAIASLGQFIGNTFNSITGTLSEVGTRVSSAFTSGLRSGVPQSSAAGTALASSAATALGEAGSLFSQNGTTSSSEYATAINSQSGPARNAGSNVGKSAVSGLGSASTAFASAGSSSASKYASGVTSRSKDATTAGEAVGKAALSGMKGVDGYYNVGRDADQGYIDGLMSKAHEVADAAASVVRNALQAARDAIDSHSPSREYFALGEDSDQGYIDGVNSRAGKVNSTLAALATGAMGAFYKAISRADMAANSDFVVTPRIAPVLDTGDISNSMNYLTGLFNTTGGILGSMVVDIDNNGEDIAELVENTRRILNVVGRPRPINIDGKTTIGWLDRELGALG